MRDDEGTFPWPRAPVEVYVPGDHERSSLSCSTR